MSNSAVFSVTYGNNKFVAVGQNGKGAYSTDGITWNVIGDMRTSMDFYSVTYGNGKFVAVGYGAQGSYSLDGITWTAIGNMHISTRANAVAYGNDKFVAGGYYGAGAYSTDGITWTAISSMHLWEHVTGIAYGNGKFVAVDSDGKGAYSTDGITWTAIGDMKAGHEFDGIVYGNDKFVAVDTRGLGSYSLDGITWTAIGDIRAGIGYSMTGIAYGSNTFVALGTMGKGVYSTDGITWTAANNIQDGAVGNTIAYGNGKFVVGGGNSGESGRGSYADVLSTGSSSSRFSSSSFRSSSYSSFSPASTPSSSYLTTLDVIPYMDGTNNQTQFFRVLVTARNNGNTDSSVQSTIVTSPATILNLDNTGIWKTHANCSKKFADYATQYRCDYLDSGSHWILLHPGETHTFQFVFSTFTPTPFTLTATTGPVNGSPGQSQQWNWQGTFSSSSSSVASSSQAAVTHGAGPDGTGPIIFPTIEGLGEAIVPLGDIDGDGVPDMAVGAPGNLYKAPFVYILHLRADGRAKSYDAISYPREAGETTTKFGSALANVGDLDGNGVPDLAVGAFGVETGTDNQKFDGEVWVFLLEHGNNGEINVKSRYVLSSPVPSTSGPGIFFGASLTSLGNGKLAIASKKGVWIASLGPSGMTLAQNPLIPWNNTLSVIASAGDFDKDGAPDLIEQAAAYPAKIHYLNATATAEKAFETINIQGAIPVIEQSAPIIISLVSLGDINGDGLPELGAGVQVFDQHAFNNRGLLYVEARKIYFGGCARSHTVLRTEKIDNASHTTDHFGTAIASVGDVNNDGVSDFAVGASWTQQTGGSRTGSVQMFMQQNETASPATCLSGSSSSSSRLSSSSSSSSRSSSAGPTHYDCPGPNGTIISVPIGQSCPALSSSSSSSSLMTVPPVSSSSAPIVADCSCASGYDSCIACFSAIPGADAVGRCSFICGTFSSSSSSSSLSSAAFSVCGNGTIEGTEQCDVGIACVTIQCLIAPCPQSHCNEQTCSCVLCPAVSAPACAGGVLFPQIGLDANGCQRPPVCCEGAASGGQCTTNMSCTNGRCVVDSCTCGATNSSVSSRVSSSSSHSSSTGPTHIDCMGPNGDIFSIPVGQSCPVFSSSSSSVPTVRSNLAILNFIGYGNVAAGTATSYQVFIKNGGPAAVPNVYLDFFFPQGFSFIPGSSSPECTLLNATGVRCIPGNGTMAVDADATFTIGVQFPSTCTTVGYMQAVLNSPNLEDTFPSNNQEVMVSNVRCSVSYAPTSPATVVCGNNAKEDTEQCDDGNTINGDGCSGICTVESGWTCTDACSAISDASQGFSFQSFFASIFSFFTGETETSACHSVCSL